MKKLFLILTALISVTALAQTKFPLEKIPSTANIVRGEDTKPLFDGDFNTVYNPTTPGWVSMFNPVVTEILTDVTASVCIPRQLKYVQQNANNIGTKLYFVKKATKEKILVYTFEGQGGYMPDTYRVFDIPAPQQFDVSRIILEAPGGGPAYPAEVQLWGDYTEQTVVLKNRTPLPLVNLLGFNCYPWNTAIDQWPSAKQPFDLLKPSRIRVYDDYSNVFENGQVKLHWNQLSNYATLKSMGVQVKDCIQGDPGYPYPLGEQRKDPATYLAFARDLQKYAVANKAAGSPVALIQAENELDKNWKSSEEYMDGYALAAYSSVCYDGHKGKYPDAGVKQIGGAKFVNPGCATDKTQILYQMLEWTIANRGYRANGSVDFPFDVYEFHWYQSLGGQYAGRPGGMPPELVIGRVKEIVDFFRRYCPEMEIHIGEYGLDTAVDSDLNAPAFGKYNPQQSRGIWFVRDQMWFAELGIDGSDWYRETMDWQDSPNDPGGSTNILEQNGVPFMTMDLVRSSRYAQPVDYTRRIVGDYFRQISNLFRKGYVFDVVVSTSPYVFRFKKPDGSILFAVWNLETVTWPDGGGRATITENITQYTLNQKGQLLRLVEGGDAMSTEPYNGQSITVDAKPVFIEVLPVAQSPLPVKLVSFTAEKINQAVILKWIVQDADKVEVERSGDGIHYTNLGEGLFNKLVDMNPANGKNYYRLKMYEKDGSFTYSNILVISFKSQSKKVIVYDAVGRSVMALTTDTDLRELREQLKKNVRLGRGMYLLSSENETLKFIKQ